MNPSSAFVGFTAAIAAWLLAGASTAIAQAPAAPAAAVTAGSRVAASMRDAADRFIATLNERQRGVVTRAFDDRDRVDWHYTPRSRNGLSFRDLDPRSRDAVHALLKTALSARGYRKVVNIIELELVLREMSRFGGLLRDPEKYHVTLYGAPSRTALWGWRFEGHHLSLNFTLAGDRFAVDAPSFFGANPATVAGGPRKGLRALADEHDAGWALLDTLNDAQRREAIVSQQTYGEIVTTNRDKVEPLDAAGIAASKLDDAQRALLWKVVETYASSFDAELAAARLARAKLGGIESLRFAWAGSTKRGAPHYYRIQGAHFLIEYDASQDGGNHIHTVWRDFAGDFGRGLPAMTGFGRDLLREHYAATRGTAHRHR